MKMVMIPCPWALTHKPMPIQIQAKPTAQLLLRTVTEDPKAQNRRSCAYLDRSPLTWPGRQWPDCLITISIPYHIPKGVGRGLLQKRGVGSQVWMISQIPTVTMPNHFSSQVPLPPLVCPASDPPPSGIPIHAVHYHLPDYPAVCWPSWWTTENRVMNSKPCTICSIPLLSVQIWVN